METIINGEEKFEIKTHDFEESIDHLKVFSEQSDSDLAIMKVNGSKGWGEWFAEYFKGGGIGKDHKVTGDELNEVTTQIQKNMIVMNDNQKATIAEFGRVYDALKALDNDYIKLIIINMEGIRKTNKKIEDSQEVIKLNQKNIKNAQDNIEKAHGTLKKTVQLLQRFKEKIDQYKHLSDIDKMWFDVNNQQELSAKINDDIRVLSDLLNKQTESINVLNETRDVIMGLEHLVDMDSMYDDLAQHANDIVALREKAEKQQLLIANLESSLKDKDEIINKLELSISSKIKMAYFLVGGAAGLAVIELILILLRVM